MSIRELNPRRPSPSDTIELVAETAELAFAL
jgi:hypothetical protein